MYEMIVQINRDLELQERYGLSGVLPGNTPKLHQHLATTSNITNAILLSGLKNMYVEVFVIVVFGGGRSYGCGPVPTRLCVIFLCAVPVPAPPLGRKTSTRSYKRCGAFVQQMGAGVGRGAGCA